MKEINIIIFTFFLLLIFPVKVIASNSISLAFLIAKNDTVSIQIVEVVDADEILPKNVGDYTLEIVNNEDDIIFSTKFDVKFFILSEPPEEVNESFIFMRLPWQNESFKVNFYHFDKIIYEINISDYICNKNNICESDKGESLFLCPEDCKKVEVVCGNKKCESGETQDNCCKDCGCPKDMKCVNNKCESEKCGNGDCEKGENYGNCSKDCPSGLKDGYCDGVKDGLCDPDCSKNEDIDCGKGKIIIYVIIGVIMAALLFFIFTRSRREV